MRNLISKFLLLIIFFVVVPFVLSAEAASLNFDKSTATAANGATFQISVTVNPGSDALNSTDVYVTYDATLLKATAVSAGTMFPTVSNDISTSGKVYIAGMVNDPASSISTTGTLATITFQGLKEGTGTLAFDCSTSKIIKNDINASNVITCSSNGTAAVTVGSGGAAPTAAPPSQLPQTGIFDNVIKFALPGGILLILGSVLRLVL
ncbi:MAG: cohesin domain-containing protein [Patescibacteria group bacterium]